MVRKMAMSRESGRDEQAESGTPLCRWSSNLHGRSDMCPSPASRHSGGPASLMPWVSLGALSRTGWLAPFVGLMALSWVVVAPSFARAPAAVDPSHYVVEFEDEQVRVLRIRLEPGREAMAHDHPDAVLVYFTADLQGRMPPAEAEWPAAGVHGAGECGTHAVRGCARRIETGCAPRGGAVSRCERDRLVWDEDSGYPTHRQREGDGEQVSLGTDGT